jgi:CheY-like chemotaxis protein
MCPAKKQKKQIHLLLIDDDPNMQRMITLFLQKEPIQLDVVSNGRMALQKLQEKRYDMIISDMQMPLMSGLELVQKIRALNIKSPVIIISAYAEDLLQDMMDSVDVFATLSKPFDSKILKSLIESAYKSKR